MLRLLDILIVVCLVVLLVELWIVPFYNIFTTDLDDIIAVGPEPPPIRTDIGKGETVWGLVEMLYPSEYNTGDIVKKIEKLNPSLDLNRLQVGDSIYLPSLEEVMP